METTIEIYRKGADNGDPESQYKLGCEYILGDNVEWDQKKGFELIKLAAEQGHGLAMRDLGCCYQFGYGTKDDIGKALEWYDRALEVIEDSELETLVKMFKEMLEPNNPTTDASATETTEPTASSDQQKLKARIIKTKKQIAFYKKQLENTGAFNLPRKMQLKSYIKAANEKLDELMQAYKN